MSQAGILLVDKPVGPSSHSVVAAVRRALGVRRVGHAGTLDPDASGLLVVGVGAGTRLLRFLVGLDKTYVTAMRFGIGTTTDDAAGEPLNAPGCAADADVPAIAAGFVGTIQQRPSAVSAVKVAGRRAYDLVRAGEEVDLPPREVTVHSIHITEVTPARVGPVEVLDAVMEVRVSSGTYIRALARDMGAAMGSAGHVTRLRRTAVGPFDVARAVAPDQIGATVPLLSLGAAAAAVLPVVTVPASQVDAVSNGRRLASHEAPAGPTALVDPHGGLLSVAESRDGLWHHLMVVPGRDDGSGRLGLP